MEYFYYVGKDRRGPVSSSQIKSFAQSGMITPDTIIEADGKKYLASKVKGLSFEKASASEVYGMEEVVNTPPPMPTILMHKKKTLDEVEAEEQKKMAEEEKKPTLSNFILNFYIAISFLILLFVFNLIYAKITGYTITGKVTEAQIEYEEKQADEDVKHGQELIERIQEEEREIYKYRTK